MTLPSEIKGFLSTVPSWPFRTASARSVWEAANKILESDPEAQLTTVLQSAIWKAGIPSYEITEEDYSLLVMAIRWKALSLSERKKPAKLSSSLGALPSRQALKQRM